MGVRAVHDLRLGIGEEPTTQEISLHECDLAYKDLRNQDSPMHYQCSQVSKEGDAYEVPIAVAKMSQLVTETLDGDDDDDEETGREIPLPNVSSPVLEKVIEFCTHYTQVEQMTAIQTPLRSPKLDELVQEWYAAYVRVERNMLFDLVAAANFMDIKPLLDLTCLAVSILIKGKSATELREMFNLTADLTPEEEAQAQRDQQNLVPETSQGD